VTKEELIDEVARLTAERDAAVAASSAKSEFLSNMSHEMRTPMNAIIGMTAIALGTEDADRKDYALGKIDNASKHLLGVINDILDLSKIEAGKFELSFTDFVFEKMLAKVVNVMTFRVDERHQIFNVRIDPKIPDALRGDDQRLSQVIANLLSNAVKFTPEYGEIRLNAELASDAGGRVELLITVADTGIGVTEEQKSKLFHSFSQANADTARKFGGTGLGLAISKNIVEMMGGNIWVESAPGSGATFSFTAILEPGSAPQEAPAEGWGNLSILVVDDEPDVREYFAEMMHKMGASCDTAGSGAEAIRLIKANGDYDVCFVDWLMPDMDGMELSRRIKASHGEERSVVVMISAAQWNTIEDEANAAGVDRFLPKPFFASDINDVLIKCFGVSGKAAEEPPPQERDDFTGCRLLLAEDVEINREIVIALLEPTGIEIDCAADGQDALEKFLYEPEGYDLIFMDVQMPNLDGYDATRAIRASGLPGADTIPIVAMTANVFKEDIERCLEAGMDSHIGKPLNMDEVLEKLRKYVKIN
jgi:CheY-like chemotaxis protein